MSPSMGSNSNSNSNSEGDFSGDYWGSDCEWHCVLKFLREIVLSSMYRL
jgi:hypothetical protein